jgi:hypothetical protein
MANDVRFPIGDQRPVYYNVLDGSRFAALSSLSRKLNGGGKCTYLIHVKTPKKAHFSGKKGNKRLSRNQR